MKKLILFMILASACAAQETKPKDEFAEFNPPPPMVEPTPAPKKAKVKKLSIKKPKTKINPDGK